MRIGQISREWRAQSLARVALAVVPPGDRGPLQRSNGEIVSTELPPIVHGTRGILARRQAYPGGAWLTPPEVDLKIASIRTRVVTVPI